MGLISEFRDALKCKCGRVTIADVEAGLARLREERAAAEAGLPSTVARRRELLLADAPDDALVELDQEADRQHLALERLEVIEPELLDQLQALRAAARRNQWAALVAEHDSAVRAYLAAAAQLIERYGEVVGAWDKATASGFAERQHRFVTLPHPSIVTSEIFYKLEREFGRLSGVSEPATAGAGCPARRRQWSRATASDGKAERPRERLCRRNSAAEASAPAAQTRAAGRWRNGGGCPAEWNRIA